MSKLSKLNSNSINGLLNIDCDTINTSIISNDEFNTLNTSNINTTLQDQLNNLIISSGSGNLNSINTKNIYITKDSILYPYPIQLSDGSIIYFKISSSGAIYITSLYLNNTYIDFTTYITTTFLTSTLSSYITNSSLSSVLNGYFQKTETWSRSDISNINSDLKTTIENDCKTYTDTQISTVNATFGTTTAALSVSIAGVSTALAITNATVATHTADLIALNGTIGEQEIAIDALQTKTLYQSTSNSLTPSTNFINNLNISNGVSNAITLSPDGSITSSSLKTTNINAYSTTLNLNASTISIGNIGSIIYIGGVVYNPLAFLTQW